MGGLGGRGSSVVWHDEGLEYRHARLLGLVRHSMRRRLQAYGLVGGRREKNIRKLAEAMRGGRGQG